MRGIATLEYPVPNPQTSDLQAQKSAHQDLAGLSDFDLWREKRRLEDVLAWDDDPHPWYAERYRAVRSEQTMRRRGSR